jgi:putative FmdB family regulatory protein
MPTYEYECKICGHSFEAFQRMSEPPLTSCPLCGKEVRRLINGGTGIIFKGSGFYVTDKNGSGGKAVNPAKTSDKPAGDSASSASVAADTSSGSAKTDTGSSSTGSEGGLEKKAAG